MPAPRIAIVTDHVDAHADVLIGTLVALGNEPVRVNTSDLPLDTTLTARLDAGPAAGPGTGWSGSLRIETNGRVLDWRDVTAVWWRRPGGFGLSVALSAWEREFAEEELRHATRGIWACLDAYWMSRPEAILAAGYKIEQLQRAARLGFAVPRTLVTTDPAAVRAFHAECGGRIVYKVLTDPYLMAARTLSRDPDATVVPGVVQTTVVTERELAGIDSVRNVPCLFQEYVDKRAEYRVTVIGDDVFVAEIDSQACADAAVDWRGGYDRPVPWRVGTLPDEVTARCVALVRSYGLQFSALDLIGTPDGRWVFLENNPNGQFLFVQERVPQLRMAEALAARLLAGRG